MLNNMDIKELIIRCYKFGNSISYITQLVYKRLNKAYFDNYHQKGLIKMEDYTYMSCCRNLVEKTILEYNAKQQRA